MHIQVRYAQSPSTCGTTAIAHAATNVLSHHTKKDFAEHITIVQEDNSVGSEVRQGVSYVVVPPYTRLRILNQCVVRGAMKVIHGMSLGNLCIEFSLKSMRLLGIGEIIRGLAIDITDLGKGSGKTIAADSKTEANVVSIGCEGRD